MEEKLRNLSNNIENNTGENAYKPEAKENHEPENEAHEHVESHQDETPWEEAEPADNEPKEEPEETKEDVEDEPRPEEEKLDEEKPEAEEPEEAQEKAPEETPEEVNEAPEEPEEAHEPEEAEEPKAAILTMDSDEGEPIEVHRHETAETPEEPEIAHEPEEAEEPEEAHKPGKYSPEVEAALSRLGANNAETDSFTEPLSTEPKKKSHGGHIFLGILFFFAILATALCILVEQGIIDNPLLSISKQEGPVPAPSELEDTEEIPLTDATLISAIDALFEKARVYDNYYIYKRVQQRIDGVNYVYYYVAEPIEEVKTNKETELTTNDTVASQTDLVSPSEPTDNCGPEEGKNCTSETATTETKITADNYMKYPTVIYTFAKNRLDIYEFRDRSVIELESEAE